MEDILIPIAFFAMIAAIVIAPRYLRSREREKLQETLRLAIEKGQPIPPEIVAAIASDARPPPSPDRDLRRGIIWLAVAAGLAALGGAMWVHHGEATFALLGAAAFPGFIGLAFIVIALISRRKG